MRTTATHVYFWSGPLSNWHLGARFGGERAYAETVRRLDALGIGRPSDAALSSRLLRAATFSCGEHWMMACKAWLFDRRPAALDEDPSIDVDARLAAIVREPNPARMAALAQILATTDPKRIKELGSARGPILGYDDAVWEAARVACVVGGNVARFETDRKAMSVLRSTGDRIIVEGSPVDRIWGVGLKWDDDRILDPMNWCGRNLLGLALGEVREQVA